MSGKTDLDLDGILDEALDEFEKLDLSSRSGAVIDQENEHTHQVRYEGFDDRKVQDIEFMESLMKGMEDPEYGKVLQNTLKSLSASHGGKKTVEDLFSELAKGFEVNQQLNSFPTDPNDQSGIEAADLKIAATLDMLSKAQQGMEGFEASKIEETGESLMNDMMSEFENLGEKEDYNEVVDGVMRQLLSRDLMYEPLQQICEKFPEWLATHRESLTEEEYVNHGLQYQTFQKLLAVYDTEPDNFPRIMELMFDMQNFGIISNHIWRTLITKFRPATSGYH